MSKAFFIIPKCGGIAYLNIPKSACSSILHFLSHMRATGDYFPAEIMLDDGSDPIHGFYPPYTHMEHFSLRWPVVYPPLPESFLTFTFVRNPYARMYSFYTSKIQLGQAPGKYYEKFGIKKGCSFEKCVNILTSIDPQDLEHHAIPQSILLINNDKLLVDYVGKLENIEEDWIVIQQLFGTQKALGKANQTRHSSQAVYTPELQQRVYDYYRNDFELFGYDFNDITLKEEHSAPMESTISPSCNPLTAPNIERFKGQLLQSGQRVKQLANTFNLSPEKRDKYFLEQSENFFELTQKHIFQVSVNSSRALKGLKKNLNESQQAILDIKQNQEASGKRIQQLFEASSSLDTTAQQQGEKVTTCFSQIKILQSKIDSYESRLHPEKLKSKKLENTLQSKIDSYESRLHQVKLKSENLESALRNNTLALFKNNRNKYRKRVYRFLQRFTKSEYTIICDSGLLDPNFYFTQYPEVITYGISAAQHYLNYGAQEGKNPSARFNTLQYLLNNPEVVHEGINPLVHFVLSTQSGQTKTL